MTELVTSHTRDSLNNFVTHLQNLALRRPQDTALTVLQAQDGKTISLAIDYATLDARVRSLAAMLQERFQQGQRVLLLLDNDDHYVVSFFACLYAGLIAVPAFPPESTRRQHLERLTAIAIDAQASCILASRKTLDMLDTVSAEFADAVWIAVDECNSDKADAWIPHRPAEEDIAFLQYTSGSTSAPKGVMVSHGNLLANERSIQQAFAIDANDVIVSWLPLYHDMGLIGGMLQPIFSGVPLVLMAPQFFLERPVRWLEAVSTYGGTVSGGPDFAYRLCCERVKESQLGGIDLSSWRVAFSGAEPVRHDTLQEFMQRFSAAGFCERAVYPCYGLAEATLLVSGGQRNAGMHTSSYAAEQLATGTAVPAEQGTTLVACGRTMDEHLLQVVQPGGDAVLGAGAVGEIWVHGPSIAHGYWNNPNATQETFVVSEGKRWLRTGDLGFVHDAQIYITGRAKDLIIVRGHNLYPQDIERIIEAEVEAVRKGRVASFAVQTSAGEGIGIAAEVSRGMQKLIKPAMLVEAIGIAVGEACGEAPSVIVLLNPGGLPKTSSGKLQRSACRSGWLNGSLDAYASFEHGQFTGAQDAETTAALTDPIELDVAVIWKDALRWDAQRETGRDTHFFLQGGNSLTATAVAGKISERWNISFTARHLFEQPRLGECAQTIRRLLADDAAPRGKVDIPILPAAARAAGLPLSHAQQRLWFMWQLDPDSTAYHVGGTFSFDGKLDVAAMHSAVSLLLARHASLRTVFLAGSDGAGLQKISETSTAQLQYIDLVDSSISEGEVRMDRHIALMQGQPFDLTHGPLIRIALLRLSESRHVLAVVAHHIIVDGASMNVLAADLLHLYRQQLEHSSEELAPVSLHYADYAAWERQQDDNEIRIRAQTYWREQLAGEHLPLALPLDYSAGKQGVYRSAVHSWQLDNDTALALRTVSERSGTTIFAVLLTTLQVLLHRYSGQEDIRVGVPLAIRNIPAVQQLVGLFVNTVVLRSHIHGRMRFSELLGQVQGNLLDAQTHGDLPFEKVLEVVQTDRSLHQSPLFDVLFNQIVEGVSDLDVRSGLTVHGQTLLPTMTQFNLSVEVHEKSNGACEIRFIYAQELFESATIARLAQNYEKLLRALLQKPESTVHEAVLADATDLRHTAQADIATFSFRSVHQRIAAQAVAMPDKLALVAAGIALSYQELNTRANRLAHRIIALGITPESRVGIAVERGADMVIALLAVLKAGAAYLPIDPALPAERVAYMLQDSGIALLLLDTDALAFDVPATLPLLDVRADVIANEDTSNPAIAVHPAQLAYLIYTSGSTGQPKGVMVAHGALSNFLDSMQVAPGLHAEDVMLATTSLSFDIAGLEIYLPLLTGACLVVASKEQARDGMALAALLEHSKASVLQATPAGWRLLLAGGWRGTGHRLKGLCGGEALHASLARELQDLNVELWNMYGPTETTIWSSATRVTDDAIVMGQAIAATELYVLDADMQVLPTGVAGELYIGGIGLARGYWKRAGLSAERFVANPYSSNGALFYRTGDLVRRDNQGRMHYLGRLDHQVKIRGFRIELGEIEATLLAQPEISAAIVVAARGDTGDRLIAYVTTVDGRFMQGAELSAHLQAALARSLPEYMVPGVIVVLDAFPLNNSGKVDRKALPVPELISAHAYEAPSGTSEEVLAQVWMQVLGVASVGRADNFFALGGDSILSLKMLTRAAEQGLQLNPKLIFANQSLRAMAAVCTQAISNPSSIIEPLAPSLLRSGAALSNAQQRQWFLWQMDPTSSAYHISGTLHFTGQVDHAAAQRSFAALLARHDSLRTVFRVTADKSVVQIIAPVSHAELAWIDLTGLTQEQQRVTLQDKIKAIQETPFDLAHGPLIRAALLRHDGDKFTVVLAMHHIVSDGWSMQVIIDEFSSIYRAETAGKTWNLPALPVQYADYAAWQRAWLQDGESRQQLAWWQDYLGDDHPVTELASDHPRRTSFAYRARRCEAILPASLAQQLAVRASTQNTTLFAVLLAAFQTLLHRHTRQPDIRIGIPVTNRRAGTEGIVGFFVNAQVIRTEFDERMSLQQVMAQVSASTQGAQAHQDLPFEQLVEALQPGRDLSHSPLFRIVMNHQRVDYRALHAWPKAQFLGMTLGEQEAQFELALDTTETPDGEIKVRFSYAAELFDDTTIERLFRHYCQLLTACAYQPEQTVADVPLLSQQEYAALVAMGQPTHAAAAGPTLHALFEFHAHNTPDAIAIVDGADRLNYAAVNQRANQLAHALIAQGIRPEARIGLALQRSADLIVAILAILKSGAAYVPLDLDYPAERLSYIVEDSRMEAVLIEQALLPRLPTAGEVQIWAIEELMTPDLASSNPGVALRDDGLAYVIYTSGSTGRPKGAQLTHRNVARLMSQTEEWFHFDGNDVWTLFHSFAFDFSVWEIFGALCQGGRLLIVPFMVSRSPTEFADLLFDEGVTVLNQTPSAFRQLMQVPGLYQRGLPALRTVIFGGEELSPDDLRSWIEHFGEEQPRLINMYGITETTVHVTFRQIRLSDLGRKSSPIGSAIPDLGLHVLDTQLHPCPVGIPGELHVSGAGLARGYLGRLGLSAERFIADPFDSNGGRLYRTGDLARRRYDGQIEYLGRIDDQVKIRGFRIELGEIESRLRDAPGVRDAVVIARAGERGDMRLLAYIAPELEELRVQAQLKKEQTGGLVGQWENVFNTTYASDGQAPSFRGWNSSYTDEPLPLEQMSEWLDETVRRINSLQARSILEIGCGVGLLVQKLAPHASEYVATDLSPRAIADLSTWLAGQDALRHVVLRKQEALDFSGLDQAHYDLVVINSVAQYFPDPAYFIQVLQQASKQLSSKGSLFIGDLRHLAHLPLFHTAVELKKADPDAPLSQLRARIARAVSHEKELVIDSALFELLRQNLGMAEAKVLLRRGRADNELTQYRYDVVLHRLASAQAGEAVKSYSGASIGLQQLEAELSTGDVGCIRINGIPNKRMSLHWQTWQLLHGGEFKGNVRDLRLHVNALQPIGLDPEDFWGLGERLGYEVSVSWTDGASDGRFDVELTRANTNASDVSPALQPQRDLPADWYTLATNPAVGVLLRGLGAEVRTHIATTLPDYMIPSHFSVLDALPLTPSGKLDRRALPEPETAERGEYVAPEGAVEEALALLWAEVLGVERIGRDDNFFEVGGHSLMAIQITGLLAERHGVDMPVRRFFDHHTIAELARTLDPSLFNAARSKNERLSQLDDLLREFEV